jgi:hypothetical protein
MRWFPCGEVGTVRRRENFDAIMPTTVSSTDPFALSFITAGSFDVADGGPLLTFNETPVASVSAPVGGSCVNVSVPGVAATSASFSGSYIAFRVAVEVYVVGALCLAGFLGNALSIAVLYRDGRTDAKRNTTNLLLQVAFIVH